MTEAATDPHVPIESDQLKSWLTSQRWFQAKSRTVSALALLDQIPLPGTPDLALLIAQVRFAQGTHDLYQLPVSKAIGGAGAPLGTGPGEGAEWHDALASPETAHALMALIDAGETIETERGKVQFRVRAGKTPLASDASVRAIAGEQSNSSLVIDDRVILKIFRRLEPGINPELEMVRFLRRHDFRAVPAIHGFYEYEGDHLTGTLGVASEFVTDGIDGWELALTELVEAPERFIERAAELGRVTAQMHNTLASDASDPAFSAEEPSHESLTLLTANIDDEIEQVFRMLPADSSFDSIRGRGDEVRALLQQLPTTGSAGTLIRIHGDYHLGQTLYTPRGWMLLDFEGEPARPLAQRRMKRSPLRDVASMLRSFDYAVFAEPLLRNQQAPEGTAEAVRASYLDAYLAEIDPAILPAGHATITNVLALHELEKAVYELRYEINNRPDWVTIPATGIVRLLESA